MERLDSEIPGANVPRRRGFRAAPKRRRAVASLVLGGFALVVLAYAGAEARTLLHVPLPGAVIGLTLLAILLLVAKRLSIRSHRRLTVKLLPAGRFLVSHMSLLFVPAGVGIITEGATLRSQCLPLLAGLVGSTIIGLITTGWVMHRLSRRTGGSAS